jgi:enamine deaminase RidA (YjgF/YER057c/UK114 family)
MEWRGAHANRRDDDGDRSHPAAGGQGRPGHGRQPRDRRRLRAGAAGHRRHRPGPIADLDPDGLDRVEPGAGALVFTSGVIAVDPSGAFVGAGDIRAQTERVFENLRTILEANGATFADVIKITTYLTDLGQLPGMVEVRRRHNPPDPPASTTVEVSRLFHPDALIEVEVVAIARAG